MENVIQVNPALGMVKTETGTSVKIGSGAKVTAAEGDVALTAQNTGNITADTIVDVYGAVGVKTLGPGVYRLQGKIQYSSAGQRHGGSWQCLSAGRQGCRWKSE